MSLSRPSFPAQRLARPASLRQPFQSRSHQPARPLTPLDSHPVVGRPVARSSSSSPNEANARFPAIFSGDPLFFSLYA